MSKETIDIACGECGNVIEVKAGDETGMEVGIMGRLLLCRVCKVRTIHRRVYDAVETRGRVKA
jgi:hypothetical protein